MSLWSLYSAISWPLVISSPYFSHGSPLGGEGSEKGVIHGVKSVSLASLAPPFSVEALHTAPALSNGASATELHGNSVPCLPNGAAVGRTSA